MIGRVPTRRVLRDRPLRTPALSATALACWAPRGSRGPILRCCGGAPPKGRATKKTIPAKPTPKGKGKKAAKAQEAGAPREGSKMAQVIAMLRRKNGATITEIVENTGWQKHTVRGFMAGVLKKAGYTIESFKPEGGQRTYRLNK